MKRRDCWNIVSGMCLILVSIVGCAPSENTKNHRGSMTTQVVAETYSTPWEARMAAATIAYQQGRYADAENSLQDALTEAEQFGKEDRRMTMTLVKLGDLAATFSNLASYYRKQGRNSEAESLYKRLLAIWEKVLGPRHPHVAKSLEKYASLLRESRRDAEAAKLEARAKAIRAGLAQGNSAK